MVVGCGAQRASPWRHPTPAQWAAATSALRDLRARAPREPFVVTMTTTLRDPHSGRTLDGRGAMAVDPGRAVRMILVGAAGATVLDAWVTPDRWRIAVPAFDYVRRGGSEDPEGLPVAFLRWWFFERFDGVLFAAGQPPGGFVWLLRSGGSVIDLRSVPCGPAGRGLVAERRSADHAERVEECRPAPTDGGGSPVEPAPSGAPRAGDWVRYTDETSGLLVGIEVESVKAAPTDGEAFVDPDAATRGP